MADVYGVGGKQYYPLPVAHLLLDIQHVAVLVELGVAAGLPVAQGAGEELDPPDGTGVGFIDSVVVVAVVPEGGGAPGTVHPGGAEFRLGDLAEGG